MNPNTRKLHELGQRLWLDNITREMLTSGTLARYIAELSVTGLTSNPTIFEHAIGSGEFYDDKAHCDLLASERWQLLAAAGARPQRLLRASTGTKDPAAPDTLYVGALAAEETIDTIPEKTLLALADHGKVGATLPADGAEEVLDEFKRDGVDDEALAARLQREGVQAFAKSWSGLMARIREKSSQPASAAARSGAA